MKIQKVKINIELELLSSYTDGLFNIREVLKNIQIYFLKQGLKESLNISPQSFFVKNINCKEVKNK